MRSDNLLFRCVFIFVLLFNFLRTSISTQASHQLSESALVTNEVTAFDLIIAMNTLRMSYGLPALIEDPIINAVAQSTAQIMAANQMSSHIGDVRGRLAAAGYGGGATVWATENFAVGTLSIDQIMIVWSDATHMIPAVNPAYCNVGAGVAKSSTGSTYYVLQAAYTSEKSCGEYTSVVQPGSGTTGSIGVSQLIIPVKIATPDADGKIFHVVEAGQSFWAIAIAYKITIKDLEIWNNISQENKLQIGQRLFIPGSNTKGYSTPTPVGMIQISTPDLDGKIIHTVQPYQTLITIAKAYGISIDTILNLNGIKIEWPLLIGQKLIIHPGSATPSPTPRPLTPIEKLTPEGDGKYYHTIKSGETLTRIAKFYEVSVTDLMTWNGLNASTIVYPDQKLILQVTPPATETPIPAQPTNTLIPTLAHPTMTAPPSHTSTAHLPTATIQTATASDTTNAVWIATFAMIVAALLLVVVFFRKRT